MDCWIGSGMKVTAKAGYEMTKLEACHCENYEHYLEEVQEALLEVIKIGRFTYGKQVNRDMLQHKLTELLDNAISEYGKDI
jgi:hypothetical protein|tara:strand:+ start:236 stop:478 length:243 start_codon:yes stop_codon:yes gene_type:complete